MAEASATRALHLFLRRAGDLQREAHVLAHRHVRIERVGLEHHRDVARARRQVVDDARRRSRSTPSLISSSPAIMRKRRRLAAAGRADQRDEFAIGDVEIDAVHDLDLAVALGRAF